MEKQLKLAPFFLTSLVLVVDQISKALIEMYVPVNSVFSSFFDGFFRIVHVRNTGIAFSMGHDAPDFIRNVVFLVLPLALLGFLVYYYFQSTTISTAQRWTLAGIIGGGLGNLVDRLFRPTGVVDFLDVKFYGLFGFDRWPTFNIADTAVVICGILLAFTILFQRSKST